MCFFAAASPRNALVLLFVATIALSDQAKDEFIRVMHLHARYYDLMNIKEYYMRLSLPDMSKLDKYVDAPEKWIAALEIIKQAMQESGYKYIEGQGEAAFSGPEN